MEGREMTVLPAIFQQLAAFNYNKAKDLADKERAMVCSQGIAAPLWPHFLACLAQLAAVEKLYMNLSLLTVKGFLRRENCVRASYEALLTDLTELEGRAAGVTPIRTQAPVQRPLSVAGALGALGSVGAGNKPPLWAADTPEASAAGVSSLLLSLCSELLTFIRARICLIKFYEACHHSSSAARALDYSDLAATIAGIASTHTDSFTQPLLTALQANLKHECDVLQAVMQGMCSMGHHSFLATLLHFDAAHEALLSWQKLITCRESKKYSFGTSFLKGSTVPALYQWLWQVRAAANAKFSLYFYDSLSLHSAPADLKLLLAKQPVDYVAKLVSFYRRVDASSVSLVLETSGIPDYRGPGYHLRHLSPCLQQEPATKPLTGSSKSKPPSGSSKDKPPSGTSNGHPPSGTSKGNPPAGSSRGKSPTGTCNGNPPSESSNGIPTPPPLPPTAASTPSPNAEPPPPPVRSFERIFCCPMLDSQTSQEKAHDAVCWTSLLSYLPKPADELPALRDNVLQVYQHQTGYTHYLCAVENLVTLVVSYDCHRTERESLPVREFLNEISQHLNLVKVFAALKPR